ncbi:MAG TPA: UDP-glucose/GDP-mannose dehydrogenase family protein [Chloroflexota bacterium]|nr:UDP-glucose/GDP-mannose dehydrogenase family protein [Chloroflexota bacterium]
MARVSIIGTGYVGLTTGACFAHLGHDVTCIDIDREKIARLREGDVPIYEPGLNELIDTNVREGRLHFSDDYTDGLRDAEIVYLAVGTPTAPDGKSADLKYVYAAAASVARALNSPAIVVNKSTSPVGTATAVARILDAERPEFAPWRVASNPEFLQEGSAVHDCLNPARVVIGASDPESADHVASLYDGMTCPIVTTDLNTAEMIKYASNAFLATRISFVNEVARIADALDADIKTVTYGMGLDPRIGPAFLNAGLGYGGSCFPKDVLALAHMGASAGIEPLLLESVTQVNSDQRRWVVERISEELGGLAGRTIGLWGLTFKPNTDDVREAPALDIARQLADRGATIRAYDPMGGQHARNLGFPGVVTASPYDTASGADALLLATEWDEFLTVDWNRVAYRMRGSLVFDGRNRLDAEEIARSGLRYVGIGRRTVEPSTDAEEISA